MSLQLIRYNEPLAPEELDFLQNKQTREMRQFYKVVRIIMIICFIIPFGVAGYRAADDIHNIDPNAPNPFSFAAYFTGVAGLLSLLAVGAGVAYYKTLRKLHADIRHRTKTIEQTHITRKQYMPQNNTCYFYIDSPTMLSIEVSADDFNRLNEGDEVNIEYTTYSKIHLGYF